MTSHKWILLVDDNANDAALSLHVLTNHPCPVIVVHVKDGAEALDCLYRRDSFRARDTGPPALLLLDLKMPRVDGFEVLQQIKSDRSMMAIPVAVFTSSDEPTDLARSYELGTNAYVVKPVDFQAFNNALREIKDFWLNYNRQPPDGVPARGPGTARQAEAQTALNTNRQDIEK